MGTISIHRRLGWGAVAAAALATVACTSDRPRGAGGSADAASDDAAPADDTVAAADPASDDRPTSDLAPGDAPGDGAATDGSAPGDTVADEGSAAGDAAAEVGPIGDASADADPAGDTGEVELPPACTWAEARAAGTLAPEVGELSGLAVAPSRPDILWAHNDSGDGAVLYGLRHDGTLAQRVEVRSAVAIDWEDMAVGPCGEAECLYIGDIGDNIARRAFVRVYRVPVPAAGIDAVDAEVLEFAYADGPRDAEGLWVDAAETVWIVAKNARAADLWQVPFVPGAAERSVAARAGTLPLGRFAQPGVGLVTAADLHSDEGYLLVRTYATVVAFRFDRGDAATLLAATPEEVVVPRERQGEAVAWGADGFWHASEGEGSTLYFVGCSRP